MLGLMSTARLRGLGVSLQWGSSAPFKPEEEERQLLTEGEPLPNQADQPPPPQHPHVHDQGVQLGVTVEARLAVELSGTILDSEAPVP